MPASSLGHLVRANRSLPTCIISLTCYMAAFVATLLLLGICCYRRRKNGRGTFGRLPDEQAPMRRESETALVDGYMRAVYASEEQSTHTRFRAQNTTSPPINVISPSPPVSQWGLQDEYSSIEHGRSLGLAPPGQAYIDTHRVQSVAPTEVTDTTESSWRTWQVDQSRATQKKDWKRSMFF